MGSTTLQLIMYPFISNSLGALTKFFGKEGQGEKNCTIVRWDSMEASRGGCNFGTHTSSKFLRIV